MQYAMHDNMRPMIGQQLALFLRLFFQYRRADDQIAEQIQFDTRRQVNRKAEDIGRA